MIMIDLEGSKMEKTSCHEHEEQLVDFSEGSKSCTTVVVNIYLRSINDIDDYKMEFSVQVTFREQWNDERLAFDDFDGKPFFKNSIFLRKKNKFQADFVTSL